MVVNTAARAQFVERTGRGTHRKELVLGLLADRAIDDHHNRVLGGRIRRYCIGLLVEVDADILADFVEDFVLQPTIQVATRLARAHFLEISMEVPLGCRRQVIDAREQGCRQAEK